MHHARTSLKFKESKMKHFLLLTAVVSLYIIYMAAQEIHTIYQTNEKIIEIQKLTITSPKQVTQVNTKKYQKAKKESKVKKSINIPLSKSEAEYKQEALIKLIPMEWNIESKKNSL